ncbi:hypothetical protein CTAYLR_009646 [Chrysophaeum taylorii]|uniref:Transporter n=1 Tax=Chrysophaeum taylorii TaxID=2483200 RepID=A0AAD7U7W6_9STRA|nr:hypothetical protein CTAYLR_009646 [Chrysophaeum taylorii]
MSLFQEALGLQRRGEYEAAHARCVALVKAEPEHARGWALQSSLERSEERALAAAEKGFALRDLPVTRRALAQALTRVDARTKPRTGLELLERAAGLVPLDAGVQFRLGRAARQLRRPRVAADAFRAVLAAEPGHERARFWLATIDPSVAVSRAPIGHVKALYDDYAPRYDDHLRLKLRTRAPELVAGALAAHAAEKGFGVDLGCGTGLSGVALAKALPSVRWIGVDLSTQMCALAWKKGAYHRVETNDMLALLEGSPGIFDCLVSCDVLVYVGDLADFFRAARCAAKPSATLAISLEDADEALDAKGPTPPWRLTASGRFTHAPSYVRSVAAEAQWTCLVSEAETLRHQAGQPAATPTLASSRFSVAPDTMRGRPPKAVFVALGNASFATRVPATQNGADINANQRPFVHAAAVHTPTNDSQVAAWTTFRMSLVLAGTSITKVPASVQDTSTRVPVGGRSGRDISTSRALTSRGLGPNIREIRRARTSLGANPAAMPTTLKTTAANNIIKARRAMNGGEVKKRERWASRSEFLLATVGQCVGVGNVWRFPYLCYKNGGGTFLIPYFLALGVIGVPIFLLELSLGQRFAKGNVYAYRHLDPRLGGVGVASTCMSFVTLWYYNIIVAWTLVYMAQSCRSLNDVPWRGGEHGVDAERFWHRAVLWRSDGFEEFRNDVASPELVLASFIGWTALFFATRKGVQSTGKVAYVSATLPYVLLVMLVARGVTLEGASEGLAFYLKPRPRELVSFRPWLDAANQIIYSLGVGGGGLIAFGSYNPPDEDVVYDSIAIAALNSATSLFAGVAIFAMLGHKARVDHKSVSDVVDSGEGLAFVAYPDGLSHLPGAGAWCFVFFAMLFALALDSSMAMLEAWMTMLGDFGVCDDRTGTFSDARRQFVCLSSCFFGFVVSFVFIARPGIYWFALVDSVVVWGVFAVAVFECLGVSRAYGGQRFTDEILQLTRRKIPDVFSRLCWPKLTPALCVLLGFISLILQLSATSPKYEGAHATVSSRVVALVIMLTPLLIMALGWVFPEDRVWYLRHSNEDDTTSSSSRSKGPDEPTAAAAAAAAAAAEKEQRPCSFIELYPHLHQDTNSTMV